MKTLFTKNLAVIIAIFFTTAANAQNIFPSTGRAGIYTTSPASSLQVKGGARIGTTANYLNVDSATGNLSFVGTSAYQVAGNKYAFQYTGNPNYGLFFNSTTVQYEFRNGSASPVFSINANTGNGVLNGTLKIGTYTLPSTDGTSGQVLKTNGSGVLSWGADNGTSYTAGTGISISGTAITNTAPDKTVTLNSGTGITVTGTYPSFTIASTGGYANQALSNLTTTSIDTSLFPSTNNAFDLGSSGKQWRTLYSEGINAGGININGYDLGGDHNSNLYFGAGAGVIRGEFNTVVGADALQFNSSGIFNVALGADALVYDTSGSGNIAIGPYSLFSNTNAGGNEAIGNQALFSNTTGSSNIAIGSSALYTNDFGNNNIAIGSLALLQNDGGNSNTAIGTESLSTNGSGNYNTGTGDHSLYNTFGSNNTGTGYQSLYSNTSGYNNTSIGFQALYNSTGFNNTAIGVNADVSSNGYNNSTAVGILATITASNQVRVGSIGSIFGTDPTSIGGKVNFTALSDGRVKKNIKENVPGLTFINKLKPITYNIDNDAINKIVQRPAIKDKDGKTMQPSADEIAARKAEEQVVHTGFIAQDVEKAAKSLNYDFSGVDAAKNDKDLYGLRYAEFVVPLVKAVQELSNLNDAKDAKIDTLQNQLNELRTLVLSIQQQQQSCSPCSAATNNAGATQSYAVITDAASLQQNIPNPFTNNTTIGYSLPQKISAAQIIITDKSGKTLKAITISGSGKGSLTVNASTLSSGAYQYSLVVDGRLIDTKQMVLAK